MNNETTADSVTDAQIDALRTEAAAAGDIAMVAICDTARREGGNWGPSRRAARRQVAEAINAARAMES